MYAKAHPFGYIPVKSKVNQKEKHFRESVSYIQTVRMPNGLTRAIKHYAIHSGGLI